MSSTGVEDAEQGAGVAGRVASVSAMGDACGTGAWSSAG